MKDNKKMTDDEIEDLVKKTMDEVMAAITPGLEAKHTEYMEKRATLYSEVAEAEKAEAELEEDDEV
tara:strand:+ start:1933 stop:2130 length:198 start_codon:yes stop_codon:yes gene_type:complete